MSQKYYLQNGIISKRERPPTHQPIAIARPTTTPTAPSSNPFVEQIRQLHKKQMREAFEIVMAEVQAEVLGTR